MDETKDGMKAALAKWLEKTGTDIAQFAADTGYTYQSAWNIVKGKQPVTVEVIGRFAKTYGGAACDEWFALAGQPNDGDKRLVAQAQQA